MYHISTKFSGIQFCGSHSHLSSTKFYPQISQQIFGLWQLYSQIHTSGHVRHLQRMMSRFDHTSCSQWGSPRSSLWSGCTLIWANHTYPKAILLHQIWHTWSNNHMRCIIYNEILDGQVILKNRIAKMMNL